MFEVGDKVKVTENYYFDEPFELEQIGTIREVDDTDSMVEFGDSPEPHSYKDNGKDWHLYYSNKYLKKV